LKRFFQNYHLMFFVGFFVVSVALGIGSVVGQILSPEPLLSALRSLGAGMMIAGLAMWIALLRDEAGQSGLSPLFALFVIAGLAVLVFNVINPNTALRSTLEWGGIGAAVVALVLGVLAMLIAPAYPSAPTSRWPEGGEPEQTHSEAAHH
jgi:hypothetical protein